MPSRAEIVSFDDSPPPPGADPWVVAGAGPGTGIDVTDADPAWPRHYEGLASRIREALGWRVLQLEHVGSTAVPGLAAKPVIDIDLTVADPARERDYVRALETIGFQLMIREPWWHGHRMLWAGEPPCNLHVFGFDSPELVRHRIFRDWLRGNPGERNRYAAAKRQAASDANAAGEHVMQYNTRKQHVIRDIYHRAFVAAGLLEHEGRDLICRLPRVCRARPRHLAAARWAAMFWSGSTAITRAPAARSRRVTSPVPGPISTTDARARRPQREARISYTSAG